MPAIESPDTRPEYVIAAVPTVPNVIVLPWTVPVKGMASADPERMIVPLRCELDCVQLRTNVP